MDKLLVVGVDTVIGANVALTLADRFDVRGVSARHRLELHGITTEHVHQADIAALARSADDFRPQWILYCGSLAAASWDLPAADPAWEREPEIVKTLLDRARAHDARLTALLTDGVFRGPRMFHDENSPADSRHAAAGPVATIEKLLSTTTALVVRTHAYGWAPAGTAPPAAERMWRALSSGAAPPCDGRHYATPILATDLAELLFRADQLRLQGLLHLAGAERTNHFRMAGEMAAVLGLAAPGRGMSVVDRAEVLEEIVGETSLTSRRARRSLETPMPMLREGLERFAAQASDGCRQRSRSIAPPGVCHEQAA